MAAVMQSAVPAVQDTDLMDIDIDIDANDVGPTNDDDTLLEVCYI